DLRRRVPDRDDAHVARARHRAREDRYREEPGARRLLCHRRGRTTAPAEPAAGRRASVAAYAASGGVTGMPCRHHPTSGSVTPITCTAIIPSTPITIR